MEYEVVPGIDKPKHPQSIVLTDATTGLPITTANPLPVSLGADSIQFNGSINIGTAMEINNDEGNPIPVIGPATNAELRLTPLPISGTVAVTGGLTDTQLRSSALSVTGPATNSELRATPLPVSGTVGISGTTAVTGPATNSELRAAPLPVTGTLAVTGGLTNTELRSSALPVSVASMPTTPVTGTFWQATQPVSVASVPLAPLAATSTKQPALGTAGVASADVLTVQGVASMTPFKVDGSAVTQPVSGPLTNSELRGAAVNVTGTVATTGTFWPTTQPISASALPLPTNAATSVKQPALGTSGSPSPDVLTVQGSALMTPFKVDGSAVTQPVSGSVTVTGTTAVSGPATNSELRATPLPVSGTLAVTGPLTNSELRLTALPVSGPLTSAELRASALPISGTVTATGPLTDTQLRNSAVNVTGTVTATGPLTDSQLRTTAVNVAGPITNTQLRASAIDVVGPLTDAQLRLTSIAVSGPATNSELRATPLPVSGSITATGPLTNSELRFAPVPVSGPLTEAQLRATPITVVGDLTVTGALTNTELRATPLPVTGSFTVTGGLTNTELRSSAVPVSIASLPSHAVTGTFWQPTQPISAVTLPLPTNAATSAKQPALGTAGVASADVLTVQGAASMTALKVDGSAVTQPVSGTVTATGTFWQATQPISASTLPLPTNAATSTKQPALGAAGAPSSDVLTVQGAPAMTALKVDGSAATQPISATALPLPTNAATSAKQPSLGAAGTPSADVLTVQGVASMTPFKVDGSAVTQPVSVSAIPLAPLAATSTKQPALGTAGTPSVDVLTIQGAALMTALKVDGSAVTQPVSGPLTDTQLRSSALNVTGTVATTGTYWQATQPVSVAALPLPPLAATSTKQPALGTAGAASADVLTVQGITSMTPFKVDGSGFTQPVSGTVSVAGTLPVSGPLTDAQLRNSAVGVTGTVGISGTVPVSGPATNSELRLTPLPVSGTVTANGTFWQATQPVSIASLPLAPLAATSAKQPAFGSAGTASGEVLSVQGVASMTALKVDGSAVTQPVSGSVSVTGTVPVSISSMPTTPVSGTFWQATQPVSVASVPLAPLAATSTKQPALGIAGTAATDVLTVQGIASMTPFKVDGSAVTQPVSGSVSVTGNVATTGTFWQATQPVSIATMPITPASQSGTWTISALTDNTHDTVSGSIGTLNTAYGSTATPTPVSADGDAVRLWATRNGALNIADGGGSLTVDGTFWQATQPVSMATIPVGAATSAKQPALGTAGAASADVLTVQGTASMTALKVDGSAITQPVSLASVPTHAVTVSGSVATTGTYWQTTQPVSMATIPVGAATSAKQPALGTAGTSASDVITVQGIASMTPFKVDGSAVTQPVSGTVAVSGSVATTGTFWQATQPISAAALPLPTNAATSTKQPNFGIAGTPSVDIITVQGAASMTALKVDASATTQPVSGTFWQATQPVSLVSVPTHGVTGPATNTELRATPLAVSGTVATTGTYWQATQPVSMAAIPVGAATSAKQPALGTAGAAASDVITVQGVASMTALKVDGSAVTQPVSGTVAVSGSVATTGTFWQATQPISAVALPLAPLAATSTKQPALGVAGTPSADVLTVQGAATMTPFKVDGSAVTQPVSLASVPTHGVTGTFWQATQPISAISLPLPSGAASLAKQPALGTAGAASADVITVQGVASMTALKVDGSAVIQPVSGPATNTELRATPLPISGTVTATGTFFQTTQPVSITTMPTTPVTGTFWQATQPISAISLPLPSGAASLAKQPSLGTAGAASADVITVQGVASMTALKVDGSAVTQPVSGPVTDTQMRASALSVLSIVADGTGITFDPDSCSHVYAYSNGLLITDTATNGANIWVKTYGYTASDLTSESKWVKQ